MIRILTAIGGMRNKSCMTLGKNFMQADSFNNVTYLTHHPLLYSILLPICYQDVFQSHHQDMFDQLQDQIKKMINGFCHGEVIKYIDSKNPQDSFTLSTEYKGRLVKTLIKCIGALNLPRDRHDRH